MDPGQKGLNSPNFRNRVEGMERSHLLVTNNIQYHQGAQIMNLIDKYWIKICKKSEPCWFLLKLSGKAQTIKWSSLKVKCFPIPEHNLDFFTKKGRPQKSA